MVVEGGGGSAEKGEGAPRVGPWGRDGEGVVVRFTAHWTISRILMASGVSDKAEGQVGSLLIRLTADCYFRREVRRCANRQ